MREQPRRLLLALAILLVVGLACGPCNLLSGEVPTPPHEVAVSTEVAGQLESRLQQNLDGPPGQPFILTMTDAEVTSLLDTELAKYDESPLADPVIWFTAGKIYGTGRLVNVLPVEAQVYLVASARVIDGQVSVTVEELSAGLLPIPDRVLDLISQSINETVDELQLDVTVTSLDILEGQVVVQGVPTGQ